MTNAHCSTCGDPVFRYDGQEFCPTCQKPITRESGADDGADDADGDHIEVADTSDEARVQFGGNQAEGDQAEAEQSAGATPTDGSAGAAPDGSADPAESAETAATAPTEHAVPSADDGAQAAPSETGGRADQQSTVDTQTPAARPPSTSGNESHDRSPTVSTRTAGLPEEAATDLTEAKKLLAETAHQFAQRAADSQDPRDAREHLKAAREAAAALDATNF
ncbi:Sjogren's syndrome/scleroderma autoantigen 1 family protein [Halomicroarcula sp. GCM10025709]